MYVQKQGADQLGSYTTQLICALFLHIMQKSRFSNDVAQLWLCSMFITSNGPLLVFICADEN